VNVFAFVLDVVDARGDVPRLAAALASRRALVVLDDRAAALALLAAPRKSHANVVWFARIYPGAFGLYLLWFWWGGFPGNLSRFGPSWLRSQLRVRRDMRGATSG
jgi:hypothetical protein